MESARVTGDQPAKWAIPIALPLQGADHAEDDGGQPNVLAGGNQVENLHHEHSRRQGRDFARQGSKHGQSRARQPSRR